MISYNEALKIAMQLKSRIDKCVETPNAYLFKNVDDEYSIGGEGICCILKENGKAIGTTEYYDKYANYSDDEVKEYDVIIKV